MRTFVLLLTAILLILLIIYAFVRLGFTFLAMDVIRDGMENLRTDAKQQVKVIHRSSTDSVMPLDKQILEIFGSDTESKREPFNGMLIDYQYQLWKIKPASVCQNRKSYLNTYSQCTIRAKQLFQKYCNDLSKTNYNHWRAKSAKRMYCNAAASYQSTIVSVKRSEPLEVTSQLSSHAKVYACYFLYNNQSPMS